MSSRILRAIAYFRVSSEEQAERGTIELQVVTVRAWCQQHGVELVAEYRDEGISGTLLFTERPAAQEIARALPDLRTAGVTHVLLYKWDRVGRDPVAFWSAVYALERQGGLKIRSVTESAHTDSAEALLMLNVQAGVSAFERSKLLERSTAAMNEHTRNGAWMGGVAPFGYRLEGQGRAKQLVPDEEPLMGIDPAAGLSPAGVARQIFAWAAQGASLLQLCARLNALGIPPSGRQASLRAPLWRAKRVALLLRNTAYYGERQWGRPREGSVRPQEVIVYAVPPLVERETWDAAQETLRRNFNLVSRNVLHRYLLRGLVRCGRCGYTMGGRAARGRRYYVCTGTYAQSRPEAPTCRQPYLPADELEGQVWADVEALLRNPAEQALQILAEQETAADREQEQRASLLRERLGGVAEKRRRVIALHTDGLIDRTELEVDLSRLRADETRWREELAQCSERVSRRYEELRQPATLERLALLGEGLESCTWEERREVAVELIDRLIIRIEGRHRPRRFDYKPILWRF